MPKCNVSDTCAAPATLRPCGHHACDGHTDLHEDICIVCVSTITEDDEMDDLTIPAYLEESYD